ncbi:uncharacterized protein LOC110862735 [Folsomia candida]|uniref:Uncharacterized protein n=1 Tax=Folsomia candida TaxID=158441 RepID=A0A226CW96_FOLCA|nr:uncharacterized protein LOC110862735 [Folsomia candida]OXA37020.1 hypothetical protein Fcan01_28206 [Folsomia candida]
MHLSGFEKCDKDFCQNILTDEEKEDFYKMENTSSSSTITLSPPILSVRRGRRGGGKIIESPCALLLCVCVTLLIQSPLRTSAHLASFISSEGRPNLTQRPIRGPTVPTLPYFAPSSSEVLRLPGLTFMGSGGSSSSERKMYLRNMNDRSFANVNTGISTSGGGGGGNEGMLLDYEDKPTFVPYIGPRALSSVKAYLRHLRDNLEALQSSEYSGGGGEIDYEEEQEDEEGDNGKMDEVTASERRQHLQNDRQHSRRHVNPSEYWGGVDSDRPRYHQWTRNPSSSSHSDSSHHGPNLRKFVDPPPPIFPDSFVIRKPMATNYSPSWSYTKLGLGKRAAGLMRRRRR